MSIDQDRVQKPIRKLRKFAKKLPNDPSPDEVHKLRTNARKLEAVFGALSLDSSKNERELLKSVRKIRKRAGKVRDLDVLTSHLTALHVDSDAECRLKLVEYLGSERRKQAGKLRALVSRQRAELKSRLEKASSQVNKFLVKNEPEPSSLATAHALQLSSELDSPKRLNRGNLHPYRLKVKELRYVLQLAVGSESNFVEDLGKVKDAIGEWHDWEELVAVAEDVLDHGPNCSLIRRLKQIGSSKYEQAVVLAQDLRKKYLKISAKKNSQPVGLAPAAMNATATLAHHSTRQAA
jgi:CHAD domain-containing protein